MRLRVVVMCKAPVAGRVKTRLIDGAIDAVRAAELHAAMATTVIGRVCALFDEVVVAADDPGHPFFAGFEPAVVGQGAGDLGARMQRQIDRAAAEGCDAVLIVGTDSPHMPDLRLANAVASLETADLVLGPVEDGGYDLIAVRGGGLFDGVRWSSADTRVDTLANARLAGLRVAELDYSFDIDNGDDLERARLLGWPG